LQLSYFHPDNFKPNLARAVAAGLDPERDNYVVRTVAWSSNHDFGKGGIPAAELVRLVEALSRTGRVHISAEGRLPDSLQPWRYRGDVLDLHHVMAFSRAYVGESATMAAEAAVLGVPAVYAISDYRGFVDQLADRGLILRSDGTVDHMLDLVRSAAGKPRDHWLDLRDRAVADWVNVSDYVVDALLRHAPRR
jgi:predicted glycosyltransferase